MFNIHEAILKACRLPSFVATKYLESHLNALKERKSRLEGEIQRIEHEIEELNWNILRINNFISLRNKEENKEDTKETIIPTRWNIPKEDNGKEKSLISGNVRRRR